MCDRAFKGAEDLRFSNRRVYDLRTQDIVRRCKGPLSADVGLTYRASREVDRSAKRLFRERGFVIPEGFVNAKGTNADRVVIRLIRCRTLPELHRALTEVFNGPRGNDDREDAFDNVARGFVLAVVRFRDDL